MTVNEFCRFKIGSQWTAEDCFWVETQMLKLEYLAQELAKMARAELEVCR